MELMTTAAPLNPATIFTVARLVLDWENAFLEANIKDQWGKRWTFYRVGDVATALMVTLNKANLSTKSLHRRVIEYFQAQNDLPAGTFSGAPD